MASQETRLVIRMPTTLRDWLRDEGSKMGVEMATMARIILTQCKNGELTGTSFAKASPDPEPVNDPLDGFGPPIPRPSPHETAFAEDMAREIAGAKRNNPEVIEEQPPGDVDTNSVVAEILGQAQLPAGMPASPLDRVQRLGGGAPRLGSKHPLDRFYGA